MANNNLLPNNPTLTDIKNFIKNSEDLELSVSTNEEIFNISSLNSRLNPNLNTTTSITTINFNNNYLFLKDQQGRNKLSEIIGIVENENVATHDINNGQYVIWKEVLYKASSDITNGEELSNENLIPITAGGFNNVLPLSGGTMTGTIKLAAPTGLQTSNIIGYKIDQYGNFIHTSTDETNHWNIQSNDSSVKFKIYYETGNVDIYGSLSTANKIYTKNTIESSIPNGVTYIEGTGGKNAALFVKKPILNANHYISGISIQTYTGGGWAIGNYNSDNLLFTFGTQQNIINNNNSVSTYTLSPQGLFSGSASTAIKLATGRTIQVNLASTGASTFDGSGNIQPGVTGKLGVGNGGTGLTAQPSMLVDLGSIKAANIFNSAPKPGVTGTLPIDHGGTGSTTAAAARSNLNAASLGANTFIGEQTVQNATYMIKDTSVDIRRTIVLTTTGNMNRTISFLDKNNILYGYVRARQMANGDIRTDIAASRGKGYTTTNIVTNLISLQVTTTGTQVVSVEEQPWRKALGLNFTIATKNITISTDSKGVSSLGLAESAGTPLGIKATSKNGGYIYPKFLINKNGAWVAQYTFPDNEIAVTTGEGTLYYIKYD